MMDSSFCSVFLANLFSDLLVVGLLSAFLAWWIGKQLSKFQLSLQRKEEKRAEIEKGISYLEFLRKEVKLLVSQLPGLIEAFGGTGWGREVKILTPLWDILQPSGELPRLINPQLLAELTYFYEHLTYAKRAKELVIYSWLVPQPQTVPGMNLKLDTFVDMTLSGLKIANELGKKLIHSLDTHTQILKEQLEAP